MNKKLQWFAKIGLAVGKTIVPQIGLAEDVFQQIKSGPDKKKAVLDGVLSAPDLAPLVGMAIADPDLYREGVELVNEGMVKILKAGKPAADLPDDGPDL